jgi:hypothetical protein
VCCLGLGLAYGCADLSHGEKACRDKYGPTVLHLWCYNLTLIVFISNGQYGVIK